MKVATCTPVDFEASPRFFSRDTGLLCRGFQAAGIDSVVVMPGIRQESDVADLVRATPDELESADWWKALGVEMVVLYAWGAPRFHPVAKAIRDAGIRLVQSMDTAGLPSPFADFRTWAETTLAEVAMPQPFPDRLKRIGRAGRDFLPGMFDHRRLDMMNECDGIAAVSPQAMRSMAGYAEALGRRDVADKLIVVPHPVSMELIYRGEAKERRLLAVGRWGAADATQKDPKLTLEVIRGFLRDHPAWTAEIIGPEAGALADQLTGWTENVRDRVVFTNFIPHAELRSRYATSRILVCSSRFESFHIASAEAVCCGCSIVVADHPLLASTAWFTSERSGTLAHRRSKEALLEALATEAAAWEQGERNPESMAHHWSERLHADKVARGVLSLPFCRNEG